MYLVPGLPGPHSETMSQENKTIKQIKKSTPKWLGRWSREGKHLPCLQMPRPHIRVTSILGMPLEEKEGHGGSYFTLNTEEETPSQTRREGEETTLGGCPLQKCCGTRTHT